MRCTLVERAVPARAPILAVGRPLKAKGHRVGLRTSCGGCGPCDTGPWEGNLVLGHGGKSQIATIVERTARFTLLVPLPIDRQVHTVRNRA